MADTDSPLGDEGATEETPTSDAEGQLEEQPQEEPLTRAAIQQMLAERDANLRDDLTGYFQAIQSTIDGAVGSVAKRIVTLETALGDALTKTELTHELVAAGYDKEQVDAITKQVKEQREIAELRAKAEAKPEPVPAAQTDWAAYYVMEIQPDLLAEAKELGLISTDDDEQLSAAERDRFASYLPRQVDGKYSFSAFRKFKQTVIERMRADAANRPTPRRVNTATTGTVAGTPVNALDDKYQKWLRGEAEMTSTEIDKVTARYASR